MPDPKFKKLLARRVRLAIREHRDGCLNCRARGTLCHEHYKLALRLALHPKETLEELERKGHA